MKRLTSRTAGDATRKPHYIHGPGIKKDDLLQRLGLLEDTIERIESVIRAGGYPPQAMSRIECAMIEMNQKLHQLEVNRREGHAPD